MKPGEGTPPPTVYWQAQQAGRTINIPVCVRERDHIFFIHPRTGGHLRCFRDSDVVNKVAGHRADAPLRFLQRHSHKWDC